MEHHHYVSQWRVHLSLKQSQNKINSTQCDRKYKTNCRGTFGKVD